MTDSAIMESMTPQKKLTVSVPDQERIRAALAGAEAAQVELRSAVVAARRHGASVRAVAEVAGISSSTVQIWEREA